VTNHEAERAVEAHVPMAKNWADKTVQQILAAGGVEKGVCLFLGATDTGKTTLVSAMARRLSRDRAVAVVDADIGQSHIGPPTTVGWTLIEQNQADLMDLEPRGISFVGDVTPAGHLLQLTAALIVCMRSATAAADVVLIDTPGLVTGSAASVLWWTIQTVLRPERIIAVHRHDELRGLLSGLQPDLSYIERVTAPTEIVAKSSDQRRKHRQQLFMRYFRDANLYNVAPDQVAVRTAGNITDKEAIGYVVGLSDARGSDVAVAVIEDWRPEEQSMMVRTPALDIRGICCLTVGSAQIGIPSSWSGLANGNVGTVPESH
jgi:polynucleotide 5'-hydroxyl-kinase GRC3/NOL9